MALFVLSHCHEAHECGPAFAAWKGFDSPLRHHSAVASCINGGHRAGWGGEAEDADSALAQLPPYVAERTSVDPAHEVTIP
jgi:hypothetical protein